MSTCWGYYCKTCATHNSNWVCNYELVKDWLKSWPVLSLLGRSIFGTWDLTHEMYPNYPTRHFLHIHWKHDIVIVSEDWIRGKDAPETGVNIDRIVHSDEVISLAWQVLTSDLPDYVLLDKLMDERK